MFQRLLSISTTCEVFLALEAGLAHLQDEWRCWKQSVVDRELNKCSCFLLFRWDDCDVDILCQIPNVPSDNKVRLPAVVTCLENAPLIVSFSFPVSLLFFPTWVSWDHSSDKLLGTLILVSGCPQPQGLGELKVWEVLIMTKLSTVYKVLSKR